MKTCVTGFTKEWKELEIHKVREVSGVKIVLDKTRGVHISVYLEGLRHVPEIFEYGITKNTMLIYASSPKDYDCTEEDKMIKIAEAVAEAEIVYEGIREHQIIYLQSAIDEFNIVEDKIYSIKSQMRETYRGVK